MAAKGRTREPLERGRKRPNGALGHGAHLRQTLKSVCNRPWRPLGCSRESHPGGILTALTRALRIYMGLWGSSHV